MPGRTERGQEPGEVEAIRDCYWPLAACHTNMHASMHGFFSFVFFDFIT